MVRTKRQSRRHGARSRAYVPNYDYAHFLQSNLFAASIHAMTGVIKGTQSHPNIAILSSIILTLPCICCFISSSFLMSHFLNKLGFSLHVDRYQITSVWIILNSIKTFGLSFTKISGCT